MNRKRGGACSNQHPGSRVTHLGKGPLTTLAAHKSMLVQRIQGENSAADVEWNLPQGRSWDAHHMGHVTGCRRHEEMSGVRTTNWPRIVGLNPRSWQLASSAPHRSSFLLLGVLPAPSRHVHSTRDNEDETISLPTGAVNKLHAEGKFVVNRMLSSSKHFLAVTRPGLRCATVHKVEPSPASLLAPSSSAYGHELSASPHWSVIGM